MRLSLCTISFRHHLVSFEEIARWASAHHFEGIELWGIHAINLATQPKYGKELVQSYGLKISMISDYLPLEGELSTVLRAAEVLSACAKQWGTTKVRTFVGRKGSHQMTVKERQELVKTLQVVCDFFQSKGQFLVVETHPNTLTDTVQSTVQLIEEVNHPTLRVNFDVLHIWESGASPIDALRQLSPFVSHFHFKNITSRKHLNVFSPDNVYAAAGSRQGMTSLFEGIIDYQAFLDEVNLTVDMEASLEWFGSNVWDVLERDCAQIRQRVRALSSI